MFGKTISLSSLYKLSILCYKLIIIFKFLNIINSALYNIEMML